MSIAKLLQPSRVRPLLLAAGVFVPGLMAGCSSSSSSVRTVAAQPAVADTTFVQSGKLLVGARSFADVYFDTPFATTPTLEVTKHWGDCGTKNESPTKFRVYNASTTEQLVEWKARGIKAPDAPAVARAPVNRPGIPPAASPIQPVAAAAPAASIQPVVTPPPAAPVAPPPQSTADGLPPAPVPITSPR